MEQPSYKLEIFEGPMDLLLHLISKHKLNINDIPIIELVNQYLDFDDLEELRKEIITKLIQTSTSLAEIKRSLL